LNRASGWPKLLLGTLPVLVGATVITLVGRRWLAPGLTGGAALVGEIMALMAFAGLLALRAVDNWNLGVLSVFAFLAGGFLGVWFPPQSTAWLKGDVVVVLVGVSAILLGRSAATKGSPPGRWIWLAAWVYALGWVAVAAGQDSTALARVWAAAGLTIFGALLAVWVAVWRRGELAGSTTAGAVDLYLLAVNMLLTALILVGRAPV
jgi:hypothetical protein